MVFLRDLNIESPWSKFVLKNDGSMMLTDTLKSIMSRLRKKKSKKEQQTSCVFVEELGTIFSVTLTT